MTVTGVPPRPAAAARDRRRPVTAGDPDRRGLVTAWRAPAKLTRSLRLTGVRSDGYHLIEAEMVTLDLADELVFGPGDGLSVVLDPGAPGAPGAPHQPDAAQPVPEGDDNLVRRALRAVGRVAAVRLTKRIPAGAGLGGGSADAAAVLRWAGVGAGPGGPDQADLELAAGLGADVPFCLVGGRARVRGAGEVVERLAGRPMAFVLALAPFGVSTAAVYRAWDELGGPAGPGPNDLETAALAVEPRLGAWREALGEATGRVPVLAGSGSTWFVEGAPGQLGLEERDSLVVGGQVGRLVAARAEVG